ncbi:MAG: glycoside hydrolase family 127 protein, partial [Planctomycetes bacterium]|nr:glycoside hydrolase family 127 protein [Planctomycetota bacterium]
LLHSFRVTAGLPSSALPYGGWEAPNCELRGHCLGHYLSACSLMYAATGDRRLKDRADTIVAELARCQEALPKQGYHPGYLSAFPEGFFDRVETSGKVWAPYYTLHKIMAGLLDANHYCGNRQALDILRRLADWVDFRVSRLSREQMQKALATEHGGMAESLAELYARTGDARYLRLAQSFRHDAVFLPAAEGRDTLTGLHANTQIPKFTGYQRIYELTGDPEYGAAARNFWKFVARDRSFVIGGDSTHEFFFPVEKFPEQVKTVIGPETCNTYNMLKLTARLFQDRPEGELMDFYERALYNHILASEHPHEGGFVYYTSLRPGSFRSYSRDFGDFWCCVGTGMENHAKYGEVIYAHARDKLLVNLFIPSRLHWRAQGVTVTQETGFPAEPRTRLHFHLTEPKTFTVAVRYPRWVQPGALKVTVNGAAVAVHGRPGEYAEVTRAWKDGDELTVDLPMRLTTEFLPRSTNYLAVLYGPVVLAGKLGREGLRDKDFRGQRLMMDQVLSADQTPVFTRPAEEITRRIQPVPGRPLTFRTRDLARPGDVTLIPFYRLHDERYAVYWRLADDHD